MNVSQEGTHNPNSVGLWPAFVLVLALLVLWGFPLTPSVQADPPRRELLPENLGTLVHIDFAALNDSQFGKELLEQFLGLPAFKEQLADLPSELSFLHQIKLHGLSIVSDLQQDGVHEGEPVAVIHADFPQQRLIRLLKLGREYAQVSFADVPIHHWRADKEYIRQKFTLGEPPKSEDDEDEEDLESVYLAIPDGQHVLASTSLASLTSTISLLQGKKESISESWFKRLQHGERTWLYFYTHLEDLGVAPNVLGLLGQNQRGVVWARIESDCHTDQQLAQARLVQGTLSNPALLKGLMGNWWENDADAEAAAESEDEATQQTDSGKANGSISFGIQVDRKNEAKDDDDSNSRPFKNAEEANQFAKEMLKFITRIVKAEVTDKRLVITAEAWPDRWKINWEKRERAVALNIVLALFSSEERRLAAQKERAGSTQRKVR